LLKARDNFLAQGQYGTKLHTAASIIPAGCTSLFFEAHWSWNCSQEQLYDGDPYLNIQTDIELRLKVCSTYGICYTPMQQEQAGCAGAKARVNPACKPGSYCAVGASSF
jgi:hypothetical protein